jgi:hypothetical protein
MVDQSVATLPNGASIRGFIASTGTTNRDMTPSGHVGRADSWGATRTSPVATTQLLPRSGLVQAAPYAKRPPCRGLNSIVRDR